MPMFPQLFPAKKGMDYPVTGRERVMKLMKGEPIDRVPFFDSIRNDAILEYFSGEKLTFDNATNLVRRAHAVAVDSTRQLPKLPVPPIVDTLPDGRTSRYDRWTRWVEHKIYESEEAYINKKKKVLDEPIFCKEERSEAQALIDEYAACERDYLNDIAFFWAFGVHDGHQFGVWARSLIGYYLTDLYEEVGVETFSLWLYPHQDLLDKLLERSFERSLHVIDMIPAYPAPPFGIFIGDDMAFRNGPLVNPRFLEKSYFPRLAKVVEAAKSKGMYVMFHTDGDLSLLIDGLAGTGIDILNPLEKIPQFFVKEIHKRCPSLILSGAIDVSHVLPLGTPDDVKREVRQVIEDSEGRVMIGASSIVTNNIPLENYLAMREAATM
jgi:hypothetical protein